jgi:hypothetical protein
LWHRGCARRRAARVSLTQAATHHAQHPAAQVKRRDEEEEDNTEAMRALEDEKIGECDE